MHPTWWSNILDNWIFLYIYFNSIISAKGYFLKILFSNYFVTHWQHIQCDTLNQHKQMTSDTNDWKKSTEPATAYNAAADIQVLHFLSYSTTFWETYLDQQAGEPFHLRDEGPNNNHDEIGVLEDAVQHVELVMDLTRVNLIEQLHSSGYLLATTKLKLFASCQLHLSGLAME